MKVSYKQKEQCTKTIEQGVIPVQRMLYYQFLVEESLRLQTQKYDRSVVQ